MVLLLKISFSRGSSFCNKKYKQYIIWTHVVANERNVQYFILNALDTTFISYRKASKNQNANFIIAQTQISRTRIKNIVTIELIRSL